jgi:hypothetical protein
MVVGMSKLPNYHNSIYEALRSVDKQPELQKNPKVMKKQNGQGAVKFHRPRQQSTLAHNC